MKPGILLALAAVPLYLLATEALDKIKTGARQYFVSDHWSTDGKLSTWMQPCGRSNGLCFDKDGNLYVQDWNVSGRIMKLVRVKK